METNWNNWNDLFTNWNNYYSHSWPKLISLLSFVSIRIVPTIFSFSNDRLKNNMVKFMETNWNNWNNLFTNWNNYFSHSWPKLISLFSFVSLKTVPTYFLQINEKFVLKE